MIDDPLPALRAIDAAFKGAGIPYAIGGSLASSFYGEYRGTNDIDLLVEIVPWKVSALLGAMGGAFDADEPAIRAAVARGACFNVLHLATNIKFDLFVSSCDGFHRHQMDRRRAVSVGENGEVQVEVVSPEDIILQKLLWFRSSNGVLEGQLRDVVGVVVQQRARLDLSYLDRMAKFLGVEALLADVLQRAEKHP